MYNTIMGGNSVQPTKKCKHCQTEIDQKAKICPACHKKQGGKLKFILIGLIAVILIAALVPKDDDKPEVVGSKDSTGSNNKSAATKAPEKTTFSSGETVKLNDILVTLVGVTESTGSDFNKPAEGNVFAICEFNIENNSSEEIIVSSIISFEAYCDDYSISQSISGLLEVDKGQLDGSVAAGKKMNGVIAYEVPADWKELEINFTPDFWSSKDITFIATK
jgi:hypothetical protein